MNQSNLYEGTIFVIIGISIHIIHVQLQKKPFDLTIIIIEIIIFKDLKLDTGL